jgi:hypothetical protein
MHTFTKTILALIVPAIAFAQNGPIDFESGGHGATWTWTVFENDTNPPLEIVPNPDQSGINTSATVAKFTALQAGNPWAGCETMHGAGTGSFLIDASNAQIRIMVWKSQISDVGIKLVRPDGWSLGEIKVANTVINQWEQITFDFTAHIGLTPAYDQVVIFPDFTARASDEVIYFDNVFGDVASIGLDEYEKNTVNVFPNPGRNILTIESEQVIDELDIYSISCALVYSATSLDKNVSIEAEGFSAGMYFVRITTANGSKTVRWIKQD